MPPRGIEAVQSEYNIIQLKKRYDDLRTALAKSGLVEEGLSITDMEEDKNLLEVGVESEQYFSAVQEAIDQAGGPPEVVRITARPRFKGFKTLRDRLGIRPW